MTLDIEQISNWQDGVQVSGDPRGPWSQTYLGERYYPLNPDSKSINLLDIAHQLALTNRYSGATPYPYSVAQHTLLCAALVDKLYPKEPSLRRLALLHDAAEYVLGDLVSPVKKLVPEYKWIETRLWLAIAERYGLGPVSPVDTLTMKRIDGIACAIEKRHMLGNSAEWGGLPAYEEGFAHVVRERSWREVRDEFLKALQDEFGHLHSKR